MGDMTEPGLIVRKYGTQIQISRDDAIDLGIVRPTPTEQRKRDEQHAKFEAERRAATAAWPVFVAALDAVTDPVARAVLDLHKSEQGSCHGCEVDGFEAEYPAWPCDTTTTVAKVLDIAVPEDLWMAEQARRW